MQSIQAQSSKGTTEHLLDFAREVTGDALASHRSLRCFAAIALVAMGSAGAAPKDEIRATSASSSPRNAHDLKRLDGLLNNSLDRRGQCPAETRRCP